MFQKRSTGKVVLVADIEDASVGVSIVQPAEKGPAIILAGERLRLPIEERSREQGATAILHLLEECTEKVLKTYAGNGTEIAQPPYEVFAIVRSPWTRYRTATATEKYSEPRAVTSQLLGSLAKKALLSASEIDRTALLESGVMQVFLNGYPTGKPLGKKVTRAEVIAFESDIVPQIREGILATLGKLLPGRTPIIKSGMSAFLTVLNEIVPDIHRYVILDVGGSVTNCAVVLKESVSQSAVVPEGLLTLLKRVSAGGLPEEAMAQLRMLSSDSCSTDACRALKDSLARAEPELTKVFGEALARLASKRRLPNAAILSGPEEMLPWLQGFFSRIDFSQFTATMQPFTVESLSAEHLRDVSVWKSHISDTSLSIAAGYVNIIEQSA